jgi:hypothetical protein
VKIIRENTSTAARKSKVKSQKSKDLYSQLLRHLEWYVYLRRAVLGTIFGLHNWAVETLHATSLH